MGVHKNSLRRSTRWVESSTRPVSLPSCCSQPTIPKVVIFQFVLSAYLNVKIVLFNFFSNVQLTTSFLSITDTEESFCGASNSRLSSEESLVSDSDLQSRLETPQAHLIPSSYSFDQVSIHSVMPSWFLHWWCSFNYVPKRIRLTLFQRLTSVFSWLSSATLNKHYQ